jgi:hypothetical protein
VFRTAVSRIAALMLVVHSAAQGSPASARNLAPALTLVKFGSAGGRLDLHSMASATLPAWARSFGLHKLHC